jgi:hypothetical protein
MCTSPLLYRNRLTQKQEVRLCHRRSHAEKPLLRLLLGQVCLAVPTPVRQQLQGPGPRRLDLWSRTLAFLPNVWGDDFML